MMLNKIPFVVKFHRLFLYLILCKLYSIVMLITMYGYDTKPDAD